MLKKLLIVTLFSVTGTAQAQVLSSNMLEKWISVIPALNQFADSHQAVLAELIVEGEFDPERFSSVSEAYRSVGLLDDISLVAKAHGFSGPEQIYAIGREIGLGMEAWKLEQGGQSHGKGLFRSKIGEVSLVSNEDIKLINAYADKLYLTGDEVESVKVVPSPEMIDSVQE